MWVFRDYLGYPFHRHLHTHTHTYGGLFSYGYTRQFYPPVCTLHSTEFLLWSSTTGLARGSTHLVPDRRSKVLLLALLLFFYPQKTQIIFLSRRRYMTLWPIWAIGQSLLSYLYCVNLCVIHRKNIVAGYFRRLIGDGWKMHRLASLVCIVVNQFYSYIRTNVLNPLAKPDEAIHIINKGLVVWF